ncbi:nuclease A inhibitor family protein [Oxynema sp. CENA135]|uniref:nuclease A inhibitor family protein n=1 Tax=Oxynema sp. CENA135 TaxID=984206 RepID=UPI0019096F79|nr:nuclease A inhibitor family protein [Oxynema sp. CENA135]MBK4730457.1 nuclease A inhibitor family protein [Oxynema sp. CENA135]
MSDLSLTEIVDQLRELTRDLYWFSESDYAWEVRIWPEATIATETVREQSQKPANAEIETVEFARFFQRAVEEKDWYGDRERETVGRYRQLVQFLQENLHDLIVYRVGAIEVEIFVFGKTNTGAVVGLNTISVET